jgi:hypothetical protein
MVVSCGGSKTIQKTPKFRYAGTTLSKSVSVSGNLGVPTIATNRFSTKDKAVFAHLNLDILSETMVINYNVSGDVIRTIPHGKVIGQEIIKEEIERIPAKDKRE